MPVSLRTVAALHRNVGGIPIGKIICLATAALSFYQCWKSSESDKCVKTLIADIEKCLK